MSLVPFLIGGIGVLGVLFVVVLMELYVIKQKLDAVTVAHNQSNAMIYGLGNTIFSVLGVKHTHSNSNEDSDEMEIAVPPEQRRDNHSIK